MILCGKKADKDNFAKYLFSLTLKNDPKGMNHNFEIKRK